MYVFISSTMSDSFIKIYAVLLHNMHVQCAMCKMAARATFVTQTCCTICTVADSGFLDWMPG